ncbi:MAG: M28 family peptidase [Planctomycetota bacterium]|nr:M28 family peptidase [Planctomycetota bacterium]
MLSALLLFFLHDPTLAVYDYGGRAEVRDHLIAQGQMYDDMGGFLLGQANATLANHYSVPMEVLPIWADGFQPVILSAHAHEFPGNPAVHAGQLLWKAPSQGMMIRLLEKELLDEIQKQPFSCHGAFRTVALQSPMKPAVFQDRRASAVNPDPDIQALVAQVSKANLLADVNTLVNFGTRRHFQPGEVSAQNWILQELNALGAQTSLFNYDSGADVVIGDFPGTTNPDRVVIVGAHYDSINYSTTSGNAPGADDDASGVASVLEIARILAGHNFDYTLRFCAFSGEELGLLGSEAYASHLASQGADVVGMVQLDMVAYRANGDSRSVDFVLNDTTPSLNSFAMEVYQAYVPSLPVTSGYLSGGTSDHRPFFQNGFPACFPFEDIGQYSPYIHSSSDTVGTSANDFDLARLITQGALATLAELARPAGLVLEHTALVDTRNELGPYFVAVQAPDRNGRSLAHLNLHYRVDSGNWITVACALTSTADQWAAGIPGQTAPATVEYWLEGMDDRGRSLWLPDGFQAGETTHLFRIGTSTIIYANDFEGSGDEGWTHTQVATQDDWQRGVPYGLAGDPASAFSGTKIWGNDLGPSGWNGEYASNVHNRLKSPDIDCTGHTGVHLRFRRWLTVEEGQYDQATIRVNGNLVWQNPTSGHTVDTSWVPVNLDISTDADNNAAVKVRFDLESDGGVEFGGWNLDDFELVTLGTSDGSDWLQLNGPTQPSAGSQATWTLSGAPASSFCVILWSLTDSGSIISGHSFDVGVGWKVGASGRTDEIGQAVFTAPLPPSASGMNLFLEAGALDHATGIILDSAPLPISIQ